MRFLEGDVKESCESCGWIAAIVSMIAFGTYGVPMKSISATIKPDPLVFQSYMTAMVFVTSWVILLLPEAPDIVLTPWGLVSAAFWIPGGLAVIYAVQNAGLAVAIGVGNSCIVLVSFTWGIFIFEEKVQSELWACIAVLIMICGICGMSYYSSAGSASPIASQEYTPLKQQDSETAHEFTFADVDDEQQEDEVPIEDDSFFESDENNSTGNYKVVALEHSVDDSSDDRNAATKVSKMESLEIEGTVKEAASMTCCGATLSPRVLGILAAVFQGSWGGSIMVPMHFAGDKADGMGFVLSFGIGSVIVTLMLWMLRYAYNVFYHCGSCSKASRELPPLHFRTMALPAFMSGILWSIGNLFSMVSVQYLGEGVGYSVIQLGMMVSGLWGIFLFQEITGTANICKWFGSATLAVGGILFLSYEHHAAARR